MRGEKRDVRFQKKNENDTCALDTRKKDEVKTGACTLVSLARPVFSDVSFCSKNSEESLETAYLQLILLLPHSAQAHTSQLHTRGQKTTASKFSSSHNFTTSSH